MRFKKYVAVSFKKLQKIVIFFTSRVAFTGADGHFSKEM